MLHKVRIWSSVRVDGISLFVVFRFQVPHRLKSLEWCDNICYFVLPLGVDVIAVEGSHVKGAIVCVAKCDFDALASKG